MVVTSRCLVWPSRCLVFLLCSASVHGLHVSSYQLLRGDSVPTAADRQLRRECEHALRSDSSEDAQQLALGALAARPLAVEVARGDQGRRLRRFWLPRGLRASVEELEVEARLQVENCGPGASASWRSGGFLQRQSIPQATPSLGQPRSISRSYRASFRARKAACRRPLSLTVAASITHGCSLYHLRLQPLSLTVAGWQPRALRVGGERRAEHLPRDGRPGERARQAGPRARCRLWPRRHPSLLPGVRHHRPPARR